MEDREVGKLWRTYFNAEVGITCAERDVVFKQDVLSLIHKLVEERASSIATGGCGWDGECKHGADWLEVHSRDACEEFGISWEEYNGR
jgi:hypothetical protein